MDGRIFYTVFLLWNLKVTQADVGWFWHVTDFHWDFTYWTDQLSCNGVNISTPGVFGNQWCDSPWRLVEETIAGIRGIKPDADFMLWTGDSVPHISSDHLGTDINKELVRNITMLMKREFPNTPIYATFGNHDYYKSNMFPPHGNEIYNATYLIWKEWINDRTQDVNFLKGGYYSVLTSSGIRVVALNTNMYYTKDTVTQNLTDPADQFSWLETTLTTAAANSEKVILTGHVPPGYTTPRAVLWMTDAFNKRLIDIVLRHSDVIVAMQFGHEHHDNFRLIYDNAGNPVVSLFIAPSVTPWRYQLPFGTEPAHYPGARLIKYDRQTGKQLDIIQYYVNLTRANADGKLTWQHGYNATSLYSINDVMPTSMGTVVNKMADSSSVEFLAYVNWYNTNAVKNYPCDGVCHKSVMCGLRHMETAPFQQCLKAVSKASCYRVCGVEAMITLIICLYAIRYHLFSG